MLGNYLQILQKSDAALKRVTGKACACTYPLLYCSDGGAVIGYAVAAYVPGVKARTAYYFDLAWQPLTALPAGASVCCGAKCN